MLAGASVRSIPQIIRIEKTKRCVRLASARVTPTVLCITVLPVCMTFMVIRKLVKIASLKYGALYSVQGLSESANLFEFIAYSIMLAYNFRLGTYSLSGFC